VIVVECKDWLKDQKKFVATEGVAKISFDVATLPSRVLVPGIVELDRATVAMFRGVQRLVGTL
jgi:hypothetical protein